MKKETRLLHGFGLADVEYRLQEKVIITDEYGKRKQKTLWRCPYYTKWSAMIERCYCSKFLAKWPTYIGCSVTSEWKSLSNFIRWVDSQPNKDWQSCNLDKDLLVKDNRVYSPENCVFVSPALNMFLTESTKSRGQFSIGVTYHKRDKVFEAKCQNPFGTSPDEGRYLGRFLTEQEAHIAWKLKKHEYACIYADMQDDPLIAEALRTRYKPD